ncbi:MAG: PDDEXK nuclease domain-containing protein [Fibromonadaceae bacterium]|jgi:predicted nuclease of restriction endonuclease-like (RecB) superfamily|nr:PDDEXK nuclease domain-containing protein [Fibromonadaceae bacterium]
MKKNIAKSEKLFFANVAKTLAQGRSFACKAINSAMIKTYWQIGKQIIEQEQKGNDRADYGDYLIVKLSKYLGEQFGKGFSEANLWNFRKFYLVFPSFDEFSTQCVENLSWSHIRLIMRLDSEQERLYYMKEMSQENWSVRTLERNIKTGYFKRLLSSQKKKTLKTISDLNISDFIKDPYVLEFLNIPEDIKVKETLLETAIINNLQKFLLELGKGFSFVGRQFRISTETSHFYIDLVFYNYLLKCFIVIDLKTAKLEHKDIGQVDMYVRMFDELKRGKEDNPTIGIILCADKDETIAKYSVMKGNKKIFAAKYKTILPTEKELAELVEQKKQMLLKDSAKLKWFAEGIL